ncbi:MAG: twin-arginine translocase subunit TatC [Spirosomataceae bacterium]
MPLDQPWEDDHDYYDTDSKEPGEKEMSFIDHLEELRWHLIRAFGAIAVFTILSFFLLDFVYNTIILGPSKPDFWTYRMLCKLGSALGVDGLCIEKFDFILINTEVSGQFAMAMMSGLIIGLLFAFPYAFYEIWRFVSPGLKASERKAARFAVFWVSFLFFSGVLFGYYVVAPLAINFLANFQLDPTIKNQFTIDSYISILSTLTLACGITFQLPVAVYVLSQLGLITPSFMRTYRRHALVVILIVAAIITPSPDITSQFLVALPLTLLYEVSIVVSARVNKRREKELLNT